MKTHAENLARAAARRDNRIEDLRFMADHGESLIGAAERLEIRPTSLEKFLQRNDEAHLLGRLLRNEPLGATERSCRRARAERLLAS